MTNEEILLERKLTCEAINGAMAFGYQNTNPPPSDDHWLAPFWKIGRKQAELEIALAAQPQQPDSEAPENVIADTAKPVAKDQARRFVSEFARQVGFAMSDAQTEIMLNLFLKYAAPAIYAAPEKEQVIYQEQNPNGLWSDVTKGIYDIVNPRNRRIVFTSASQETMLEFGRTIWKECANFDTGEDGMNADEYDRARDRIIRAALSAIDAAPEKSSISDGIEIESALAELINKIDSGLDTGDIVADARRASTVLDAIMTNGDLIANAYDYFREHPEGFSPPIEFRVGWNACLDAIRSARAALSQASKGNGND